MEEAPKDIKRIEILRPNEVPSMGERYEMAIAKENRLEIAEQPVLSEAAKRKAAQEKLAVEKEEKKKERKKKLENEKRSKKKKEKLQLNEEDLNNVEALDEQDEVEEGINWSSDDDDDMDDLSE